MRAAVLALVLGSPIGASAQADRSEAERAVEKPPVELASAPSKPPVHLEPGTPASEPSVPVRLVDPRPELHFRVTEEGGYGLLAGDPWAASAVAAVEERRAELAACGEGATVRSMVLALEVDGGGRLASIETTSEPAPDEATLACVEGAFAHLDLRWGYGSARTYRIELSFDGGPIPGTWSRTLSPADRPPDLRRRLPWIPSSGSDGISGGGTPAAPARP